MPQYLAHGRSIAEEQKPQRLAGSILVTDANEFDEFIQQP